jgi:hypothetical protein
MVSREGELCPGKAGFIAEVRRSIPDQIDTFRVEDYPARQRLEAL